ncbi:MAG: D-alanine--D-alanine ligase [Gammaproteobacteria bacterium]|nr:D-alanine--D-alanine ligase [Gammaproteobacteria bacterium]
MKPSVPTYSPQSGHKIAVIMGGNSSERDISLLSGAGVLESLQQAGLHAESFDPQNRPIEELRHFDCAFIMIHGLQGEDGSLQGYLEMLKLPYTGSGLTASTICYHKSLAKLLWNAKGLQTPRGLELSVSDLHADSWLEIRRQLRGAVLIKPNDAGSSLGVVKNIQTPAEFWHGVEVCRPYTRTLLVEEYIIGEEITCALLGEGTSTYALPLISIQTPNNHYDYHQKYFAEDTQYICPSQLPVEIVQKAQDISIKAYQYAGCRGWGRTDLLFDPLTQEIYLLELNTVPGMTNHSLVPMAAQAIGLSYQELCLEILKMAKLDPTNS